MAGTLAPEALLGELAGMWRSFGQAEGGEAVLRACSMTLLTVTSGGRDSGALGETLALLMRDHPSRAIVVDLRERDTPLDARVSVECWLPFGRRRQLCAERIEIVAGLGAAESLVPVLRALVVPDLPTVLWAHQPELAFGGPAGALLDLAGKVIVDTAGLADSRSALAEVASLAGRRRRVADLSWTRLTRWRETVARSLEAPASAGRLAAVSEAAVAHGGAAPGVPAYYLAAWLAGALGWEDGRAEGLGIRFEPRTEAPGGIAGVRLRGPGFEFSLRRGEGACADLRLDGAGSRILIGEPPAHELLREELSILETDAVFEDTLKRAVRIADC